MAKFRNGKWDHEPPDRLDLSKAGTPPIHKFREGIYENIGPEPLRIESMAQLKQECDKHGVTSQYERDTGGFDRPRRWL